MPRPAMPPTSVPARMRLRAPLVAAGGLRMLAAADWSAPGEPAGAAAGEAPPSGPSLRRFSLSCYNGGPMRPSGFYDEVIVDLAGMTIPDRPLPVLLQHGDDDVDCRFGHTTTVSHNGTALTAEGVASGTSDACRVAIADADNGFPWQVSIGADIVRAAYLDDEETTEVNGQTVTGPLVIVRECVLCELSLVAIGADDTTSALFAGAGVSPSARIVLERPKMDDFAKWVQAQGFDPAALTPTQTASLRVTFDAAQAPPGGNPARPANPPAAPPVHPGPLPGAVDLMAAMRAELAAESQRVAGLNALFAQHPSQATLHAQAIREGWPVEKAELAVLRASRAQTLGAGIQSWGAGGPDVYRVLEAALCLRAGISAERVGKDYTPAALEEATNKNLRNLRLSQFLGLWCQAQGLHALTIDDQTIETAFRRDQSVRAGGSQGFSTTSLSGILGNVANKALLDAYNSVAVVWPEICAKRDNKDFKATSRFRLDVNGAMRKIGPDGQIKHAGLQDAGYSTKLDTFGVMLALTRQQIYNDDLGSFLQLPQILGRTSSIRLEEEVFVTLLGNAGSFFAAGNNNLLTGAGSALAIAGLNAAVAAMANQLDPNKKPVLVTPAKLLVPPGLMATAKNLYQATTVNETTTAGVPSPNLNPHAGLYKPVQSTYLSNTGVRDENGAALTGQSTTAWYLLADPVIRAALAVAFLNGAETPTIQSADTDFSTLGMQWRCFWDFDVGFEDPVAAVRNAGA